MNKNYILYGHGGSANHGCEALVRSTIQVLENSKENISLVSIRPEYDIRYGLNELCELYENNGMDFNINKFSKDFVEAYYQLKIKKNDKLMRNLYTKQYFTRINGEIALSIGGDNYCYDSTRKMIMDMHKLFLEIGRKTVLWGCSIETELLEEDAVRKDIEKYDLITARESISYENLKRINKNTVLVCDSAFLLNKKNLPLPEGSEAYQLVGINASPLAESCETSTGAARDNYRNLIKYILKNTNMGILLIPHVVWDSQDDRTINHELFEEFKYSNRVFIIEDHNCEELKGYISRCRFFVGARTHATIAAYSTCVPTLVVGYSVKSKGIAKDLFGTDEHYVIPVQSLSESNQLTDAFIWLMNNELFVKNRLFDFIPQYKNRIERGLNALADL